MHFSKIRCLPHVIKTASFSCRCWLQVLASWGHMTPALTPNGEGGGFKRGYRERERERERENVPKSVVNPFSIQNRSKCNKTALNDVGRASRGIAQIIAPSSSNMSPWGLMAYPLKPFFHRFVGIFQKYKSKCSTLFSNK